MRTLSMRTVAALAYERGEEFDPATTPTPALLENLAAATGACAITAEPGAYERRRRRDRERRTRRGGVPDWLSPADLVPPTVAGTRGRLVHGELV